jgi:hypothetical protein
MNDDRSDHDGVRPEDPVRRSREGERMRLEHESTLSLDWETQHGSGGEAAGIDEALRARSAQPDDGDGTGPDFDAEPDIGLDRTIADPANATMRGIDSPLIAPKGAAGARPAGAGEPDIGRERDPGDRTRGQPRASDEGFRFSGASMSFGQLVVVETRDFSPDAIEASDANGSEPERPVARGATTMLVAVGVLLALVGAMLILD